MFAPGSCEALHELGASGIVDDLLRDRLTDYLDVRNRLTRWDELIQDDMVYSAAQTAVEDLAELRRRLIAALPDEGSDCSE